jgi:16S rRNA (guanine527-N7)-methyltransferase
MATLNDSRLTDILNPSGVHPDVELFASIRAYIDLLLLWNKKISLTSIENPEEIARLHFGESFFAASKLSALEGRLADVGSGAGFPGIPIKMLSPGLELSLIESNAKKAAFLSEVLRKLNLKPAEVLNTRMEEISGHFLPYDFITARAVGDHDNLLKWAMRHLNPKGKVGLFLGIDDATKISRGSEWSWNIESIPGSERRVLLIGSLR